MGSVASCVTGYEHQSPTSVVWQTHPFHAVCRRDLAEHCVVVEDRGVRGIGELGVVSGGTEVTVARCQKDKERGVRNFVTYVFPAALAITLRPDPEGAVPVEVVVVVGLLEVVVVFVVVGPVGAFEVVGAGRH